jgi:hypothetical protein
MLLDESLGNLELAGWLCGRLQDLRGLGPQAAIDTVLAATTNLPVFSVFVPFTNGFPATYIGQSGTTQIFLIDGITTNEQATGIWDAYVGSVFPEIADPKNQWFENVADYVLRLLPGRRFTNPENLIFCGYSAGGAIAEVLFDRYLSGQHPANMRYCTFGSPAPAGVGLQRRVGVQNGFRYMNSDDPVGLIPFGLANFVSVQVLYGGRRANRLANFLQCGGGLNINADGFTFDEPIPARAEIPSSASFATTMLGFDNQSFVAHSLAEYRRRLTAAAIVRPENRPLPRPHERAQRPDFGGRHERNRAAALSVQTIFAQGERQNAQPEKLPSQTLFQALRSGRLWIVYFGGAVVAVGPTKKRARALARLGNDFLRRLLRQGYVDPAALTGQFENFIGLAQEPAAGISPLLSTNLPN